MHNGSPLGRGKQQKANSQGETGKTPFPENMGCVSGHVPNYSSRYMATSSYNEADTRAKLNLYAESGLLSGTEGSDIFRLDSDKD